jgi:hypothetical protein
MHSINDSRDIAFMASLMISSWWKLARVAGGGDPSKESQRLSWE